jgi:hypothetical protein
LEGADSPDQQDSDGDGERNACDADDDDDGLPDGADNCSLIINPAQTNTDGDGQRDARDDDIGGDEVGTARMSAAGRPWMWWAIPA